MKLTTLMGLAAMAALLQAGTVLAQPADNYPSRTIQVISSQAVGGGVDALLRSISAQLGEKNINMVVDARPGANGLLATNACKNARPDGHTFCLVNTQYVLLPYLQLKPAYDPLKDFDAVTHVITASLALGVNKNVPAKNLRELVEYTKTLPPGKLNYIALGSANPVDLGVEALMRQHGITWTPIPYKGAGDGMLAFGANDVQIMFFTSVNVATATAKGAGTTLFVTGEKPMPLMPGTPTLAETGLPNADVGGIWFGLIAPPGTPKPVRERFAQLVAESMKNPALAKRAADSGYEIVGNMPDQFGSFIAQEGARSAKALAGKPKQ